MAGLAVAGLEMEGVPRELRRSQEEIMDREYFKEAIRQDYMASGEGAGKVLKEVENTNLRHVLEALIKFKNTLPRHGLSNFDIVGNQFSPESSTYIQGLLYSQALLIWIPFFLLVIFVIFIIGRFCLKKCDANLQRDESVSRDQRATYVCWTWMISIFLIASVTITLIGNLGYI